MAFTKFVDMAKTDKEKAEDMAAAVMAPSTQPDYPYGLSICLTTDELDKLGLEADCEVGDLLDVRAMCKVTSCSTRDTGNGPECRVELQIVQMAVENEDEEDVPEPVAAKAGRRYGNGAAEADDGD